MQSWRYSGETNLILSIKFTTDQYTGSHHLAADDIPKCFRAKPPSAVKRDSIRQQYWIRTQGGMENGLQQDSYNQDEGGLGKALNDTQSCALNETIANSTSLYDSAVILTPSLETQHNVIKPGTPNMGESITPISHNVLQASCNEPVPSLMEISTQTNQPVISSMVQTDDAQVSTSNVTTQHPSRKKKNVQTNKIFSEDIDIQTVVTDYKDSACQSLAMVMNTTSTSVDERFGYDKCIATYPVVSRHVQTVKPQSQSKKMGPNYGSKATQSKCYKTAFKESQTYEQKLEIETPWVQSAEDYLADRHEELHKIQQDFLSSLIERQERLDQIASEFAYLKSEEEDDNSVT